MQQGTGPSPDGTTLATRQTPHVDSRTARRTDVARQALSTLALAGGLVLASAAAKQLLFFLTTGNAGYVIYVPAVAIAAWQRGLGAGLLATLFGVAADYVAFDTARLIPTELPDQLLRLAAFTGASVLVAFLSDRLRVDRESARRDAATRQVALQEAAAARQEVDRVVAHERRANELRDAFNGIVSHELRTPITAIYGGAKLLASRDRDLDAATRQELIDDLEAEADRLYRLVEDLLVLARSERGTVERTAEPILLSRMVARVVRSEHERWPASKFAVTAAGSESAARGDETYVEQVIRNLLSNAAKYSPAGSTIHVLVDETLEGIRLRVLDDGPGIEADEAPRLFDLYYRSPRTAGSVSGAGIGLYVCRVLIEAMGGRTWGMPRPEGGAEFGFTLARAEEDPVAGEHVGQPSGFRADVRTAATAGKAG